MSETQPAATELSLTDPCRTFLEAWQRWRGDSLMPARADIALHEITALLPMLMIQEVRSPGEVIFRLAGTAVTAALGEGLTGKNYLEMTDPEVREVRARRIQHLVRRPCGSLMETRLRARNDLEFDVQVISLPLRPDNPDAPMQIVALAVPMGIPFSPEGVADENVSRLFDRYVFIDIGAGTPDDQGLV